MNCTHFREVQAVSTCWWKTAYGCPLLENLNQNMTNLMYILYGVDRQKCPVQQIEMSVTKEEIIGENIYLRHVKNCLTRLVYNWVQKQ